MAGEFRLTYPTGQTLKVELFNLAGTTRWNGTAMAAPSAIASSAFLTGLIAMTETAFSDAVGTGDYTGTLPAGLTATAASYRYKIYNAPAAAGEQTIAEGVLHWNGTAEASPVDLSSRIPAALVSGRMDSSVGSYQSGLSPFSQVIGAGGQPIITDGDGFVKALSSGGFPIALASGLATLTTTVGVAGAGLTSVTLADGSITSAKIASSGLTAIAAAIWDALTSGMVTVGSIGKKLADATWSGSGSVVVTPVISMVRPSGELVSQAVEMCQYETKAFTFLLYGDDGTTPVDDDGDAFKLVVYKLNKTTVVFQETGTAGGADGNTVIITVSDDNTQAAGDYFYRLWNTTEDAVRAENTFTIKKGAEPTA